MIDSDKFYGKHGELKKSAQKRIWAVIGNQVISKRRVWGTYDLRSFSFGFAAAFIFLFTLTGMYTVGKFVIESERPVDLKINKAYLQAINEFEKTLPKIQTTKTSVKVDELLQAKHEELKEINVALNLYNENYSSNDLSDIKQARLRNLYRQKLEVLETIISLEGGNYEK